MEHGYDGYHIFKAVATIVMIACAVAWFARNMDVLVKMVMQGTDESRMGSWDKRIKNVIVHVFGHKRLLNRKAIGFSHLIFFYGFLIIQVCAIEIFLQGIFPNFHYDVLGPLYPVVMFLQDILCGAVIVALVFAIYRRAVIKPKHVMITKDAYYIIALIYGVVGTIFMLGMADIALGKRDAVRHAMPIENFLAGFISSWDRSSLVVFWEINWWAHVGIVLFFLNYLAYSKHLHLITGIPNIFFAKTDRIAALPTPDYEDEDLEIFGASQPDHFSWKHLLDTTACTECGRCTSVCPANFTGKPLSPMKIIHDIKEAMFETKHQYMPGAAVGEAQASGEDIPLVGGRITHEELWACTSCGGCVNQCPLLIEHVDDIVDMRRYLVLMEADFPEELMNTFTAMENEGNPWGASAAGRGDIHEELEVKVLDEGESTEVLYWVGCAGSIDDRAKKVTRSMVGIMNHANVEFATLGACETCTGDPARRGGNEYLYQMLAQQNIETLNERKFGKIVTQCPHCYNALKNEYPDLGGNYEVVHHTEFIDDLIREGKIELNEGLAERVTFHDPCFLGRWNGKINEPRDIVKAMPGRSLVEMERTKMNSFCCGAGGARMWMEEHIGKPINRERTEEAVRTNPDTIAVGCPFCNTMITDGLKDLSKGEEIAVKDIAEMVAESLGILQDSPEEETAGAAS